MKSWIDFDAAPVFAIPLVDDVGGIDVCQGMLIEGPQGWGEFSPPDGLDDRAASRWLTAAIEVGTVGWPDPIRGRVPIAVSVAAVGPERAHSIVTAAGCRTAAVRVGDTGSLADDIARLEAVRAALGPSGSIRCDANGRWDVAAAVPAIAALDRAAGGLEFVEQPCAGLDEVAAVRRRVGVRVAVDQSIRESADPVRAKWTDAADIAVLTTAALGGVRRALRIAQACGLPCVVAGELDSTIGAASGVALAGVLPDFGLASQLGGVGQLAGDLVSDGRVLIPVDGQLPVAPMPPGPDPVLLRRFAPADAATARRWRARLAGAAAHI